MQNDINKAFGDINAILDMYASLKANKNLHSPPGSQLEDLSMQLNEVWEKTAVFELTLADLSNRLEKIEYTGEARKENGVWFNYLTEEKREIVQEIYQEAMAPMQEKIPSPGDIAPSAEEMMEAAQESREFLKERLKDVLNEEEYQIFLESLTPSPFPRFPEPVY